VALRGDLQRSILAALNDEARRLLAAFSGAGTGSKRLVERLGRLEAEMDRLCIELGAIEARLRNAAGFRYEAEHVAEILDRFGELWEALFPLERRELLHTLVRRVAYGREGGALRIQFHDRGDAASPTNATAVAGAYP